MDARSTDSDVLTLMHVFEPPPRDLDVRRATDRELARFGIPRRPDPEKEALLWTHWDRSFRRPIDWVRADLAIDDIIGRRDPLARRSDLPRGTTDLYGPSGWGGAVVTAASLGLNPPQPVNTVFGQFIVPGFFPASDPNNDLAVGFWVGIDGYGNNQVLQAGIELKITKDFKFIWRAWTEWYTTQFKDPPVTVQNFPVSIGDCISVLVCAPTANRGFVSFHNITTQQATTIGIDARPGFDSVGSCAEWIVEGISPELPVFFPVTFGSCSAGTKDHAFVVQPAGFTTNIIGSKGPLTSASIPAPSTVVVDWIGWS